MLFAQSYTNTQDSIFKNLDKSRISTGVLYDRVYPWAGLSDTADRNHPIDYNFARQAWLELELASYQLKPGILTLEAAQNKVLSNKLNHKGISIGFIDYDFNSIDSTALDRGALVMEDSILYDGEGNAYRNHRATMPFISSMGLVGEVASFYFDPDIYLSNTGRAIDKIEIGLDNGNSLTLYPSESGTLDISGIDDSIITATVKLYFIHQGQAEIFMVEWTNGNLIPIAMSFNEDKCSSGNPILFSNGNNLVFKGYDETIASQGKGEYRIFYRQINGSWNNCASDIKKPIIFIDGFDPGDERKITKSFNNGKEILGIWDLLKYNNETQHLGDELRKKGFDVILLNFPNYPITVSNSTINRDGGADYIERNAMVLVKMIQEVNSWLASSGSSEKIVVIGPSMGGQIARYALAYMEKQQNIGVPNMNHNTRLFVSFDSPHLGANIPIAAQQAMYHLGYYANQVEAKESYESQLRSKAARQMLIEQMDGLNKTAIFYQSYYSNLNTNGPNGSNGWPQNIRKVSLINGNANGYNTNTAGQRILHVKANVVAGLMRGIELDLYNMPNYGNQLMTYDGMVRKAQWSWNAFNTFGPVPFNFVNNNIFGYYSKEYTNILIFPVVTIGGISTFRGRIYTINTNLNGVMDIVPGGTYSTIKIFKEQIIKQLDKWYITKKSIEWKDTLINHTFIPSVSALGFKNSNFNWADNIGNRNLVCSQEIPFDNYFTAKTNEEHVHISNEAAAWNPPRD